MFGWNVHAVEYLPFGEIRLATEGAGVSGGSVGLAQEGPGSRVDIPAHGGAIGVDVDDFRVDVADFLRAIGGEGELRVIGGGGDISGIAFDLVESLLRRGGGDRMYLSLRCRERTRR